MRSHIYSNSHTTGEVTHLQLQPHYRGGHTATEWQPHYSRKSIIYALHPILTVPTYSRKPIIYALHPICQKSTQCYVWNSSKVGATKDGPFLSCQQRSNASFLYTFLLHASKSVVSHAPSLASHLLPWNSATTGYATDGALFIATQVICPPTMSSPQKGWGTNNTVKAAQRQSMCINMRHIRPGKNIVPSWFKQSGFYLGWCKQCGPL